MVYHIVTETVPTLVGMGVTSRAVDTMFGKKGRGKGCRRATTSAKASEGKKFGGKVYVPLTAYC